MGIYDRDYGRSDYDGGRGGMRFTMPAITPAVKMILIINIAVFLPCFLIDPVREVIFRWFSVFPADTFRSWQIWRLITYQFLHDGIRHILFNMLILFFFGPMLERVWGSRKFVKFYLICGACGGVLFTLLVWAGWLKPNQLVGASGAIYGMLAAGAVLYPNMRVYVLGIFPMSMKVLVIILAVMSLLFTIRGDNQGGQAAHLAGLAAGAVYMLWPRWQQARSNRSQRPIKWESKINQQRVFQADVDRILDKVHDKGISSLTRKEKKMLREATKREQKYD
jgi:membrane associated rhomboid family serine protease